MLIDNTKDNFILLYDVFLETSLPDLHFPNISLLKDPKCKQ